MPSPRLEADHSGPGPMELLLGRRSPSALVEPAPTPEELDIMLRAATSVPDHGRLQPWRFVVAQQDGRARLGDALVGALLEVEPDASEAMIDKMRRKAFVAPTMIVLVASPRASSKVPRWEQVASAACAGYAIILAARALGLGAVWKSTTIRHGAQLVDLLAMTGTEELLGWVNVGGAVDGTTDERTRPEPDLARLVTVLDGVGSRSYASRARSAGTTRR